MEAAGSWLNGYCRQRCGACQITFSHLCVWALKEFSEVISSPFLISVLFEKSDDRFLDNTKDITCATGLITSMT